MPYFLGVDLGTTYTAAAIARDGRAQAITLGSRRAGVPSVVYAGADGLIFGETALRNAVTHPQRVAREFKRRVGDPVPVLLGGSPVGADLLMAQLLAWVVDQVVTTEGEAPAGIVVTHPANWGEYKLDLLRQAVRHVGLTVDRYIPEPVAAATFYAAERDLAPGTVVAVYDLGGGTFDAAVLRAGTTEFEIVGKPDGIERLGGIDFDHAVFGHVLGVLGLDIDDPEALDGEQLVVRTALSQLRSECVDAKEALSTDSEASIPVFLPSHHTTIRLTRPEFETMIRPALLETITAMRRAIASADLTPEDVDAVLLVGGSSRIPLVSELIGSQLGRPVAVDARPKDAICMGAALAGRPVALADADIVPPRPPPPIAPPVPLRPVPLPLQSPTAPAPGPTSPPAPPGPEPVRIPAPLAPLPTAGAPPRPPGPGYHPGGTPPGGVRPPSYPGAGGPPGPPGAPGGFVAQRWPLLVAVGAVAAVLVAVLAVLPEDNDDNDPGGGSPGTTAPVDVPEGGVLVVGAEQEPECLDWLATCGISSWGFWMANVTTMPRAFDVVEVDGAWTYVPSPLLTGEPTVLDEGGLEVTYRINPDARWNDATPITCADWQYTWDQIRESEEADQTGYRDISEVDCPDVATDDKTVVVTFAEPFGPWRTLFGGLYGILPAHILENEDRSSVMYDRYEFSGGPWVIKEWTRGAELVLVPNENYWGPQPHLDQITFSFTAGLELDLETFQAGETAMVFPQAQLDAVELAANRSDAHTSVVVPSNTVEGLWFNNAAPPFDSKEFRQAFAYALDRDAIAEAAYGPIDISEAQQSFTSTILGDFGDREAFGLYEQDLPKVTEIMRGQGWEMNSDGVWEKDGAPAEIVFKTTEGNTRRDIVQDLVVQQAADAGFTVLKDPQPAGTFFSEQLPNGEFQLALYAQGNVVLEPNGCVLFCSQNIPSESNVSGTNSTRTDIAAVDTVLAEIDEQFGDPAESSDLQAEADALLAESATSLPLYTLPSILFHDGDVEGPISVNPIFGPWVDAHLWGLDQS